MTNEGKAEAASASEWLTRAQVAERVGLAPGGGSFHNLIRGLKTRRAGRYFLYDPVAVAKLAETRGPAQAVTPPAAEPVALAAPSPPAETGPEPEAEQWIPVAKVYTYGVSAKSLHYYITNKRIRRRGPKGNYEYSLDDAKRVGAAARERRALFANAERKPGRPKGYKVKRAAKTARATKVAPSERQSAIAKVNAQLDREHSDRIVQRGAVTDAVKAVAALAATITDFHSIRFVKLRGGRMKAETKQLVTNSIVIDLGGQSDA